VDPVAPEATPVAACAECIETTLAAGANAVSSLIRRFRAANGSLRVDFGNFSIITDPTSGARIILDHLLMEARVLLNAIPGLPASQIPAVPGFTESVSLPSVPKVVALGKTIVQGLEVEGVCHIFQALDALTPRPIASWEVWTSTKLQMPVFTRTIGSFGVRTCVCKCSPVEPPASVFQIPTNYDVISEV
jgi:hypothetical protein